MIVVEIRPSKGKAKPIAVHPRVTVIDPRGRRSSDLTASIARALRGEGGDVDVTAEVDGRRQRVTRDVASARPAPIVIVADELPRPSPATTTAPAETPDVAEVVEVAAEPAGADPDQQARAAEEGAAEAAVAVAESAVADSRAALQAAESAWTEAESALAQAHRDLGDIDVEGARRALEGAEARLEVAQAGAAAARRALVEAREAVTRDAEEARAREASRRQRIEALDAERSQLAQHRSEVVGELDAIGEGGNPAAVADALSALRRLREVKPKPSPKAVALADRWSAARAELAALPAPPSPPEWLVAPALAALQTARKALAEAEEGIAPGSLDREKVDAVERAHAELLEAEQRAMRKGSRTNRRRLEQCEEAEGAALRSLGLSSYGEYLQKVAPMVDRGAGVDERRVAEARAALADAEAVWEELHGGTVDPAWTAARDAVATLRAEAVELLGEECDDDDIESRLRGHLESVVDTGWAEDDLVEALTRVGATVDDDLEASAAEWLERAPALQERHDALRADLAATDTRAGEVDSELERLRNVTHFGTDDAETVDGRPAEEKSGGLSPTDPFAVLEAALAESEDAEREAQAVMAEATATLEREAAQRARVGELEAGAEQQRRAIDEARRRVNDAEAALTAAREALAAAATSADEARAAEAARVAEAAREDAARRQREAKERAAAARAAGSAPAGKNGSARRAPVLTEAVLLARVAAAVHDRSIVVVDGAVVTEQPASARKRLLALLDRSGDRVQVVVVGGGDLMAWGRGLGGRAATRSF